MVSQTLPRRRVEALRSRRRCRCRRRSRSCGQRRAGSAVSVDPRCREPVAKMRLCRLRAAVRDCRLAPAAGRASACAAPAAAAGPARLPPSREAVELTPRRRATARRASARKLRRSKIARSTACPRLRNALLCDDPRRSRGGASCFGATRAWRDRAYSQATKCCASGISPQEVVCIYFPLIHRHRTAAALRAGWTDGPSPFSRVAGTPARQPVDELRAFWKRRCKSRPR